MKSGPFLCIVAECDAVIRNILIKQHYFQTWKKKLNKSSVDINVENSFTMQIISQHTASSVVLYFLFICSFPFELNLLIC